MSEVEFDQLLDVVSAAIATRAHEAFSQDMPEFGDLPPAANDNETAWPLIPFPAGWYGSC